MPVFTESRHAAEFVMSEAEAGYSRDNIVIASGQGKLEPGSVVGKITKGGEVSVTKTDVGGGKGAITLANPAYGAGVKEGRYRVIVVEPGSDAGNFIVEDPDGIVVISGEVGVAVDDALKFTWADGGTDVEAGDIAYIDVAIADPDDVGKYAFSPNTGSTGAEEASAVILYGVDATDEDVKVPALVRHSSVNGNIIAYHSSVDDDTKKAAKNAQLKAAGIVVR